MSMRTLIITTKEEGNCYEKIRENWLSNGKSILLKTDAKLSRSDLQLIDNFISYVETEDYRLCLPKYIYQGSSVEDRIEYALSIVCAISKHFEIPKNDLYVMFHAGDLFNNGDPGRKTGALYFRDITNNGSKRMNEFKDIVDENHLFRFRHDSSISELLLEPQDETVSELCATIIRRIEQR